jgi:ATP-binding protein involved in chromosome partitioning
MDADVYGPSIPTILGIQAEPEVDAQNRIAPVERHGLRVMSMGFFMKPEDAVVWRGPMLHKTIQQFLGGVFWGETDYLLVDLPPGTGDVQLSLCQSIPLTGAVIVSTPQDVALNVAQKAIAMFRKLNAPILGVIENMSHYACAHCGTRDDIFGSGGARAVAERMGLPFLGEIPLATSVRESADAGRPIVMSQPDSPAAHAFVGAAERLAAQVSIRAMQGGPVKVTF